MHLQTGFPTPIDQSTLWLPPDIAAHPCVVCPAPVSMARGSTYNHNASELACVYRRNASLGRLLCPSIHACKGTCSRAEELFPSAAKKVFHVIRAFLIKTGMPSVAHTQLAAQLQHSTPSSTIRIRRRCLRSSDPTRRSKFI
jgi:hypothetical protein